MPEHQNISSGVVTRELVSDWLIGYPANTRTSYRNDIDDFTDWLPDQLLDATRRDVQRWAAHLLDGRGLKAATVRRKLSAVSSFYEYLVEEKILEHNPCEHLRRPAGESDPKRGLTVEEARRLIAAATDHSRVAHALIWLMAGAGLRITEAVTARIENLDGNLLTLTVKGGHRKTKPLSPPALQAVQAAIGPRTDGTIIINPEGNQLPRRRAWALVAELAEQASIDDCTPHTLRHTAATLALEAGVPIQDVQELLGHRSIETTLGYLRSRDILGATQAAANRLGQVLTGADR